MTAPAISTASAPSTRHDAAGRGIAGSSSKSAFPQSVFVASENQNRQIDQMAHIKFPKTMDEHLDWFGITPAYFHLLIESKVLPAGIEKRGDAVWNFSEVDAALDSLRQTVYFVDVWNRGVIKIGYTTNLYNRMERLRSDFCSPIELIGTIPGTVAVEACIHERFDYIREYGECFWPALELFEFMDAVSSR